MTAFSGYALILIVQVSMVSFVGVALAALQSRSPTTRHALGVIALVFVLSGPLLALRLPRMDWWRPAFPALKVTPSQPLGESHMARLQPLKPDLSANESRSSAGDELESRTVPDAQLTLRESDVLGATDEGNDPHLQVTYEPRRQMSGGLLWLDRLLLLAGSVWFAGSVASVAAWIWQRRRLGLLLRSLQLTDLCTKCDEGAYLSEARADLTTIARDVCAAVGIRKLPPIAVSRTMPMPLVFGLWRPVIIVPDELLRSETATHLRDVLIHEAAHVARHDAWISAGQRLGLVLWWWHPGVRWLNRVITRSREEICDNFVLSCSAPSQYAQTLLELAERCSRTDQLVPSLGLFELRWTLESRIRELLKPGRELMTRTKRRANALIVTLLGTVCFLSGGIHSAETDNGMAKEPSQTPPSQVSAQPPVEAGAAAQFQTVTVRGRCMDDESKPLAGARLVVIRRSQDYRSQVIAGETKTDSEGRFELPNIQTAMHDSGDLTAVAALPGHVSARVALVNRDGEVIERELKLSSNPGTLSGIVSDDQGRPIPGVTVYLPCGAADEPLPGIQSSVTDQNGRYAITDLKRWTPEDTRTFDATTGRGTIVASCNFLLKHPDYPKTTAQNSAVPQEVNVTLYPPATVEGQVIDAVTNEPVTNATVSAQGVARHGWYQTRTDAKGRYRLLMTRDHYNIWAEAEDRIAVAVKALKAERGQTATGADIRLVRGGFVVGTVFGADGNPITPTKKSPVHVAHYGPARPRTGAAVSSTLVQSDGTYRLRIAPGRNYVYSMSGSGTSGYVTIEDGAEVRLDIRLSEKRSHEPEDEDQRLGRKIRQAAEREDADMAKSVSPANASRRAPAGRDVSEAVSRKRPATRTGKLLDELAEQNASNDRFHDVWVRTLKEIVDVGPEAVPELIAELDATDDNMMMRCLGFTLRAIDDKRAVPALIRAIPKTLLPPGSDMGLRAEDESLARFMQKHDWNNHDVGMQYSFGRPIREVFEALHKLSGQSFDEAQIYFVSAGGTPQQQQLKKDLFQRVAKHWADWWEQHWRDYLEDTAYSHANLPILKTVAAAPASIGQQKRYKTDSDESGWILGSYVDPKTSDAFLDVDTGRRSGLPEKWRQLKDIESHRAEIEAWAMQEGFDLMGTQFRSADSDQPIYVLRPIELQAWELGKERWKMNSADITFEALRAEGTPANEMLLHYDRTNGSVEPKETATFLFKTREGTLGLLFVGVEVHDDSLKPGGVSRGDTELEPIAFSKGRRFGWTTFEELLLQQNP